MFEVLRIKPLNQKTEDLWVGIFQSVRLGLTFDEVAVESCLQNW
jgi:hypothetical protein